MFQEIIVALIGIIVTMIVGYKLYRFFQPGEEQKGGCNCSYGRCNTKYNKLKY